MHTVPKYLATCGENVNLFCNVTTEDELSIKRFYWMQAKDICDWDTSTNQSDVNCTSVINTDPRVYTFLLTIFNVQPKHKGTYHCKLHSKDGMKNDKTILRVHKCYGSPNKQVTDTELSVRFPDVFPRPRVVWSRGNDNLTLEATTTITENAEGTFTVLSSIKRDAALPLNYTFALFMDVEQENQNPAEMLVQNINFSGGHTIALHWFTVVFIVLLQLGM